MHYRFETNNGGAAGGIPGDFFEMLSRHGVFQWQTSSQFMSVYVLRSSSYKLHLTDIPDSTLEEMAFVLNSLGVNLAINEGAATWAHCRSKTPSFQKSVDMIGRLKTFGFSVSSIMLQSVLAKPVPPNLNCPWAFPYSMEHRILDVVSYVEEVGAAFPGLEFEIIDALPTHNKPYQEPYSDLVDALGDTNHSLSSVILDCPFHLCLQGINGNSFQKVMEVQEFVQSDLDSSFGLICTDSEGGKVSGQAYKQTVEEGLSAYMALGGGADFLMQSAWFPYPENTLPDTKVPGVEDATMLTTFMSIVNIGGRGMALENTEGMDLSLSEDEVRAIREKVDHLTEDQVAELVKKAQDVSVQENNQKALTDLLLFAANLGLVALKA